MYLYPTHFGVFLKGTKKETNFKDLLKIIKNFNNWNKNSKYEELQGILKVIENGDKFIKYIKLYPFKNSL